MSISAVASPKGPLLRAPILTRNDEQGMIEPNLETAQFHANLDSERANPVTNPKPFMQTSFVRDAAGALVIESDCRTHRAQAMLLILAGSGAIRPSLS